MTRTHFFRRLGSRLTIPAAAFAVTAVWATSAAAHLLYVSSEKDNKISVVDTESGKVVDEIAVGTAVSTGLFLQIAGFGVLYTLVYLLLAEVLFFSKEL